MTKHKGFFLDVNFIFLVLSLLFQASSVYFGKAAALQMKEYSVISIIGNLNYLLSLFFLGCQAIVWQQALKKYPLYLAYLLMSGIYVLTLIISVCFFSEKATTGNIIGTAIITIGIMVMVYGQKGKVNA